MKMYQTQLNSRRQRGFTLLEVMAAIAIGAIVLGFLGYEILAARDNANMSNAGQQVSLLQTNVRSMFNSPDYTALGTSGSPSPGETLLINSGKAPTSMITGTAPSQKLQNAWGSEVIIFAANYAGGSNNAFTMTYDKLPRSVCNDMLSTLNQNFAAITAGASGGSGTVIKDEGAATPVLYTQTAAVTACNNANNMIVFTST